MAFAQFDPKLVILAVGGAPISGYADGTFVEVAFLEAQWATVTGADGLTQRTKSNNYSGTVTVTILSTAASNDVLSALWNVDRYSSAGAVPLLLKDVSGTTLWASPRAWIEQMPNQAFSKTAESRAWVIACSDLTGAAGGNP